MKREIHVVSFQYPYPTNYGGVIDVFYKLKTLKEAGYYITLHTYIYNREVSPEVEQVVDKLYCYPREVGVINNISTLPYTVKSRQNRELLERLQVNQAPILFEGLFSCYWLEHHTLANREKWIRMHNVEHDYYNALSQISNNPIHKLFYKVEALRLRIFEKRVVPHAQKIFAISESDAKYFRDKYSKTQVELMPCFHASNFVKGVKGDGNYILYHGNLQVEENSYAVRWIIENIVPKLAIDLIVAGANPPEHIKTLIDNSPRVVLVESPTDSSLDSLIRSAKVNILLTFQSTGAKLKVVNALYKGGHCLVNSQIIKGTEIAKCCIVADTVEDIVREVNKLYLTPWSSEDDNLRQIQLDEIDKESDKISAINSYFGEDTK